MSRSARAKGRPSRNAQNTCLATAVGTARDKERDARADLMTGKRGNSLAQHNSKKVPRFAPNFTVYVLPPDVVCLYSEDRKFFLYGELYCALASAIGAGKSFQDLVRELEQDFPSDKIREALERLIDRRFIVPTSRFPFDATAAYWASLGLSPETAQRNLQKVRVRIQSIDVQGATELGAALSGLGVRVVNRSADLTVTLVNDYLEERLAELNRQHLSEHTPWLLVQPSGIFPLVGPIFTPRQKRLLDLSRRADETEPRGEGASRPQTCPLCRGFASRPRHVRTECHSTCGCRDRESDRHRLSHEIERSHYQPRPVGLDHREALRGGSPAMPRPAAGRSCATRAARPRRSSLAPVASWS